MGIDRSSLIFTLKYPCWFQTLRADTQGSKADLNTLTWPNGVLLLSLISTLSSVAQGTHISVPPSPSTSTTIGYSLHVRERHFDVVNALPVFPSII